MLKELDRDQFEADMNEGAVLLDFYSKTCGPCKMLDFVLQDLDKSYGDDVTIIKVDFEENPDLIEKYEIEGYPTLVMFKDGDEVSRKSGLQQKPIVQAMIEEAL